MATVKFYFAECDKGRFIKAMCGVTQDEQFWNEGGDGVLCCYDYDSLSSQIEEACTLPETPPFWYTINNDGEGQYQSEAGVYINGKSSWTWTMSDEYIEEPIPMVRIAADGTAYVKDMERTTEYLKLRKEVDIYMKMRGGTE